MVPRLVLFIVLPILVIVSMLLPLSLPAGAGGPDLSKVGDILGGRRTLLPDDDLIVTVIQSLQNDTTTVLQMNSDAVSGQFSYTSSGPGDSATGVGRMFNLQRDVVVVVSAGQIWLHDQNPAGAFSETFSNTLGGTYVTQDTLVRTDFTGDGFDDFAFIASGPGSSINVFTAADIDDPSQGFFYATSTLIPVALVSPPYVLAAGDFEGDGVNEIAFAALGFNNTVSVTIYRPQVSIDGQGKVTALSLLSVGSTSISLTTYPTQMRLLAGVYSGAVNLANGLSIAQLLLAYENQNSSGGWQIGFQPITILPTPNPPQVTLNLAKSLALPQNGPLQGFSVRSGYLDIFNTTEQLVLMQQQAGAQAPSIFIFTFDNLLNAQQANSFTASGIQAGGGITLGNFDQTLSSGSSPALEIALFSFGPNVPNSPCSPQSQAELLATVIHVDPDSNFAMSAGNSARVGSACYSWPAPLPPLGLAAGDTEGRSLVLGAPSKLTAQHIQPQVILGAPPMHVDYVTPSGNGTPPEVLNVSAVPHGFYSSYQTSVSDQAQSSHKGAFSFTNGAKESISGGYRWGGPVTGSVTIQAGESAGYMHNKFLQKRYSQYSSTGFDASTNTGFDDQVWFNSETHNIYIYPLLGQVACPAEKPDCIASEKVPLTVMFSGPSQQSQMSVGGSILEWYQPIHEVGNVFSYPGNFDQLQAAEGNVDLLTPQYPTSFSTDSSTHTATATWSGESNQSKTSGITHNISWEAWASITKKPNAETGGFLFNGKLSYNGSIILSSLYTSTTQLGESTGIGIVKPGTFPNPDLYQYPVWPYIFGNNPVPGTVQVIDLSTDIQTNGILRAAFTADPSSNAGAWWQSAYTLPDVALAHAARWSFQVFTPASPQPNCIPIAGNTRNQDCAVFDGPQADIWTSEFHWMKGLLITPAEANGVGPQIDQATEGDEVLLQVRVYNYSLTDTPGDSSIVVRFYGQPWDQTTLQPAGNGFLIDEVTIPPLPGFNSASTVSNWALAGTTKLDTASYSGQYLAFWVLVFIKDADGNLVPEMPGHGLKSIPPALNGISDATPYLEAYSNNVGFYKSLFYISTPNAAASVNPVKSGLKLDQVKVSASRVELGKKVTVSGMVHSKRATDGLSILFYDGNPKKEENIFDIEKLSRIGANGSHLVKTVYHADSCGTHTLNLRGLNAPVAGDATVRVTMDLNPPLDRLTSMIKELKLQVKSQRELLLGYLRQAKKAYERNHSEVVLDNLQNFKTGVKILRGNSIPASKADIMLAIVRQASDCVE